VPQTTIEKYCCGAKYPFTGYGRLHWWKLTLVVSVLLMLYGFTKAQIQLNLPEQMEVPAQIFAAITFELKQEITWLENLLLELQLMGYSQGRVLIVRCEYQRCKTYAL